MKYTLEEFGEYVKTKHPDYSDLENTDLATRVLDKYPEYQDMIISETETVDVQQQPIGLLGRAKDVAFSISEGAQRSADDLGRLIGVDLAEREEYQPQTGLGEVSMTASEYLSPIGAGAGVLGKAMTGPIVTGMAKRQAAKQAVSGAAGKAAGAVGKFAQESFQALDDEITKLVDISDKYEKSKKPLLTKVLKEKAKEKKITKEILENMSDKDIQEHIAPHTGKPLPFKYSVKDMFYKNKDAIVNNSIKNLDDPKYLSGKGIEFQKAFKKVDEDMTKMLNKAIKDVKNVPIDMSEGYEKLHKELYDMGIVDEKGIAKEFQDKVMFKKAFDAIKVKYVPVKTKIKDSTSEGLKELLRNINVKGLPKETIPKKEKIQPIKTAQEIYNQLGIIDNAIDWNSKNSADAGLKVVREHYSNLLKRFPPFKDIVTRWHDRLTNLPVLERGILNKKGGLKVGGGSKLANKQLTLEEFDEMDRFLSENLDIKSSTEAIAVWRDIQGWKAWNEMFSQNQSVFETLPYLGHKAAIVKDVATSITRPIEKRVRKKLLEKKVRESQL
tara:strand:- start:378 stop:2039 length:1662 start_codon:yes stop_codon:yes gene_type:complete